MAKAKAGRAKGGGTLERRGHVWMARWKVDGKRFTRSTGTANRREAEKKLEEFVAPFRLGTEKDVLEGLAAKVEGVKAEIEAYEDAKPALALADGFKAFMDSPRKRKPGENTRYTYECQYGRFVDWIKKNHPEKTELRQVTEDEAAAFINWLSGTATASTINRYLIFLRKVWDVLAETARITANPWGKLAKLDVEHGAERRELTVEELARVCSSVDGEMRVLFAVGMYTGLRLEDCALLDWGSVDLARGVIRLIPRKTKRNGKLVQIPVHETLAAILSETPRTKRKGRVMPKLAEIYERDRMRLSKMVQRVFAECEIETKGESRTAGGGKAKAATVVGFHSMRHTFVSLCANAGVPLAIVQSIVGHSSPAMTRHYFHVSENALKGAVAALPCIGGTETPPKATNARKGLSDAFCAILDGMTLEELAAARDEIERRMAAAGKAVTE